MKTTREKSSHCDKGRNFCLSLKPHTLHENIDNDGSRDRYVINLWHTPELMKNLCDYVHLSDQTEWKTFPGFSFVSILCFENGRGALINIHFTSDRNSSWNVSWRLLRTQPTYLLECDGEMGVTFLSTMVKVNVWAGEWGAGSVVKGGGECTVISGGGGVGGGCGGGGGATVAIC